MRLIQQALGKSKIERALVWDLDLAQNGFPEEILFLNRVWGLLKDLEKPKIITAPISLEFGCSESDTVCENFK